MDELRSVSLESESDEGGKLPDPIANGHLVNPTAMQKWVRLNVGGVIFLTTKSTLCRYEGSFFYRLCQDKLDLSSDKDESGAFLIDRDPIYFRSVLNFLRHGKLVLGDQTDVEGVLEEAEFYNLPGLIELCHERIAARNHANSGGTQVYRVLQCRDEEVTTVVSSVADGWQFEQLIPTGTSYQYGGDLQAEYLCVVSKKYPDCSGTPMYAGAHASDRATVLQQKARRM